MARWSTVLIGFSVLLVAHANATEPSDIAFAPVYDGPYVVPVLHLPGVPPKNVWSTSFLMDTNEVLARYHWYLAEITCLVDEAGQARDTFVTESMPSRNLSATIVDEFRRKKWIAATASSGPVPARFSFSIKYVLENFSGSLESLAGRLRSAAKNGDAGSQYILSRVLLANVDIKKSDLDGETLLRRAAAGGERRAMLELGLTKSDGLDGTDPIATLAEGRQWQLKAAQAGSGPAQLLVALDSWAERTDQGYARARHWLELVTEKDEPGSDKYLAALLVSHSGDAQDWKRARKLADAASHGWHDRFDPDTWQILAAASALNGDFKSAIKAQTKAIALAEKNGWSRTSFDRRLAAYKGSHTVTDEIVMIPTIARAVLPALPQAASTN